MKRYEIYSIILTLVIILGTCAWTSISCYVNVTNTLASHSAVLDSMQKNLQRIDQNVANLDDFLLHRKYGSN